MIQSPQFTMAIRRGCDAVEPTWLLCAAMISFPAPLLHKLWGIVAAIILLQILNLIRIVTLYWIGSTCPLFLIRPTSNSGRQPSSSSPSSSLSVGKRVRTGPKLMRKISAKQIIGPLLLFVLIFGLLVFPWPGWNALYGSYFRTLGEAAFSRPDDQRVVLFEPHSVQHGFSTLEYAHDVGQPHAGRQQRPWARQTNHIGHARSIGWTPPTALTIALILATPIPWRQRAWALLWGLLLIHAFILFSLQVWIWDESSALSLL